MEGFLESKDYKQIHLEWIKANRGFRPRSGLPLNYSSYLDYMSELYNTTIKQQKTAYIYLRDDYNWSKRSKTISQEVAVMFGGPPEDGGDNFFVTFNFSDQLFNAQQVIQATNRLFEKSWVVSSYAVFEYNTAQGCHPHCHMRLEVDKYNKKGKLLEKMVQSSLAKFTGGKNFIDVKPFMPIHNDYLKFDKALEKQEYLEKDKLWRIENNIPEYLEKIKS